MKTFLALTAVVSLALHQAADATDQPANTGQPLLVQTKSALPDGPTLPANTPIALTMNEELTSKKSKEGESFRMTVSHDVMLGEYVVIPKGARATGEVTWKTSKGAFGKSGKMDIALKYIEHGGQLIPIEGTFRQEGEGATVATVAGVIAVGVFAAFITGKSAVIPAGRELTVYTKEPLVVEFSQPAPNLGAKRILATPKVNE